MLLLRAALAIGGFAVLTCLLMWVFTRQRVYLRWAMRILQAVLILVLVWLGFRFAGRLAGIAGL